MVVATDSRTDRQLAQSIAEVPEPMAGLEDRLDPVLDWIGDASIVLLGEATHGTHEFYHARANLTKRLIREKDFTAVLVEADWPDAYRINRFVRGQGRDPEASDALGDFHASLADQFDAVIHMDRTRAVEPLDPSTLWPKPREPETFPTGS